MVVMAALAYSLAQMFFAQFRRPLVVVRPACLRPYSFTIGGSSANKVRESCPHLFLDTHPAISLEVHLN